MSTTPVIRRFETTVIKDTTGAPAAATIDFYKQGATVKTAIGIAPLPPGPPPDPPDPVIVSVAVYDTGDVVVGDVLRPNSASTTKRLLVHEVVSRTELRVENVTTQAITLAVGDRLVVTTNRPVVHTSPTGETTGGSSVSSNGTNGRASTYLRNKRFDYVASGAGVAERLFVDAEGGFIPTTLVNARDFATIQAAIDAIPISGGTVYIPAGLYNATSPTVFQAPLTLPADRSIKIVGDGPTASILATANASQDLCLLQGNDQVMEDIGFRGANVAGSGRGIVVGRTGGLLQRCRLLRCWITETPSWSLYVRGDASPATLAILCSYEQLVMFENKSNGAVYVGPGCTTQYFRQCSISGVFRGYGMWLHGDGHSVMDCAIQSGDRQQPFIMLDVANEIVLQNVWFEDAVEEEPEKWFVETSGLCNNVSIIGCVFIRTQVLDGEVKAVYIRQGVHGMVIVNIGLRTREVAISPENQINIVGHPPIPAEHQKSNVVLLGGVARDDNGYGALTIKDVISGTDVAQEGVISINELGVRLPRMGTGVGEPGVGLMSFELGNDAPRVVNREGEWTRICLERYADETKRPANRDPGTLIWVDAPMVAGQNVQVWDGTLWKSFTLVNIP